MTEQEIRELASEGRLYRLYKSKEWLQLRDTVMAENHGECVWCRDKGIITKAETVHHVQWVKTHPELAMSRTYTDEDGVERRNLVPLCHECHDKAHKRMQFKEKPAPITEERW